MNSDSVGRKVARASGWIVSSRAAIRLIGLVSTAILARLLVPEDFGLVAMAMLVYQIIEVLGEFNFNLILLVQRDAGRDYYDTVWTLSLLRGAATAVVLALLAVPMALFFAEPRVESIIYVLAFVAILDSTQNVGIIAFQKEFRFGRDFAFGVISKLVSFVTVVTAALLLRSYVALLLGTVATTLARVVLSFLMHAYRPRLTVARWREVFSFSRWLLAANVIRTVYRRTDVFFVSKLVGAGPLGIYSVAFELASLPAEFLIQPIQRALLPAFAELAGEPAKLRQMHSDGFALMMLVVLPVAIGMVLTADPLVRLVLGERWLDAIPLIESLAFLGCFRALSSNMGPLFLALNKPMLVTLTAVVVFVVGVPLVAYGAYSGGIRGAAYAVTAASAVNTALTFTLATRLVGVSARQMLAPVWRPLVAAVSMSGPVYWLGSIWGDPSSTGLLLGKFLTQVTAGAVCFAAVLFLLWFASGRVHGPERIILRAVSDWRAHFAAGR